ncbi:MAG: glycosyltransferase family 4 protein [Clostridiales bacterium]|nr:glycosyltransferase family 4 protein [Clostridiales bacterium]
MNIVFLIGGLQKGGAERVVVNLSNYLASKHNVTILTLSNKTSAYPLDERVRWSSLDGGQKSRAFIIRNMCRFIRLIRWFKKADEDIYVAFLPVTSYILLVLKRWFRAAIVVSVRSNPKQLGKKAIHRYCMELLFPRADGIVFQTQEARAYFPKCLQEKSVVIPNPVNMDLKNISKHTRKKQVVSVGRLEKMKNFELLIRAMYKVWEEPIFKEYQLIIYGEGSQRPYLEDLIKELKIEDRVHLPGICDNLEAQICDAALFAFSSRYEGMPNALLEAMTLGLPVVSTKFTGGAAEYLIQNGQNGLLVNDDIDEMANEIKRVLSSPELAEGLGKEARKIGDTLSIDIIGDRWERYLETILSCTKGQRRI